MDNESSVMSVERINTLIDKMLSKENVQCRAFFYDYDKDKYDLEFTFFSFLISRCILRYANEYQEYGIFKFSNPGREIMKDKNKRTAFVEEFLNFYNTGV